MCITHKIVMRGLIMKKLLSVLAVLTICTSVFAKSSGFVDLSKGLKDLDMTKVTEVTAVIPEGRELFPIIWKWTHNEIPVGGKVIAANYHLDIMNVIDDEYQITSKVYTKSIGTTCYETVLEVTGDKKTFTVLVKKYVAYGVDKNGNKTGDTLEQSKSQMNSQAKGFADGFSNALTSLSEEEYNQWCNAAYYNLETQNSIKRYAANKLKAKKWYKKYPLEGHSISITFLFTDIKESKNSGFEYELGGLYGLDKPILVTVLSNNDDYIDLKSESSLTVTGIVKKVDYTGEYSTSTSYGIETIVIAEQ